MPLLSEARLHGLVMDVLAAGGLTPAEARSCANASVFADLRGTSTHGIVYVVPGTLDSMRQGKTVSGSRPVTVKATDATALLKGAGVPGPMLAAAAMGRAVADAQRQGVGVVNTFNGNPIGMLGYYAYLAAEKGLVGLVMANTAPAAAPHGGTSAVLGTNPFAYAVPSAHSRPILFDIATTVASAGKLGQAKRRGGGIPAGWLIDKAGEPVTDAKNADAGVMLPFGGHKGSGIGILIHLLTGALAGTTVGGEPTHNHTDPKRRGQSALFLAIDPASFGSRETFLALAERQIGFIHDATPLPGQPAPLYPGERGWAETDRRRRDGIFIPPEDWEVILRSIGAAGLDTAALLAGIETEGA